MLRLRHNFSFGVAICRARQGRVPRSRLTIGLLALALAIPLALCGCKRSVPAVAAEQKKRAQDALSEGSAAFERGDYRAAIACCTEAIELDGTCAKAYCVRGVARDTLADSVGAIQDQDHAIELDPSWPLPYINRGSAYRILRKYPRAVNDYTEAIRLGAAGVYLEGAYFGRALSYASDFYYDKAIEDFTEVIRLNPRMPGAYHERGMAYKEVGEGQKAEADLKRAKELGYGQWPAPSGSTPSP